MNNPYYFKKKIFDLFLCTVLMVLLFLPFIFLFIMHKILYQDSFIFWSKRIGINNSVFLMPKIRTMNKNTPDLATHLMTDQHNYITKLGSFLRKTSIDEIPQLWSIFNGDMSFVGPRPALHNQYDLINLRNAQNIDKLIPGITGLAQIKGRDLLTIEEKVQIESKYLKEKSFWLDVKIILKTFIIIFYKNNIKH